MRKENLEIQHKIIATAGKEPLGNVLVTKVSSVIFIYEGHMWYILHRHGNMSLVVISVPLESLCKAFVFLKVSRTHFVYVINRSPSGIGDKFIR